MWFIRYSVITRLRYRDDHLSFHLNKIFCFLKKSQAQNLIGNLVCGVPLDPFLDPLLFNFQSTINLIENENNRNFENESEDSIQLNYNGTWRF